MTQQQTQAQTQEILFSDEDAKQAIRTANAGSMDDLQYITSPQEKLFARQMALSNDLRGSYTLAFEERVRTYSLKPAQVRVKAAALLATSRVDELYSYYARAVAARMDIREDRILAELAAVAFSDPADFYEADGATLKNIHNIPEHARRAVAQFKTAYTKDGIVTDLKMIDKMKALQSLISIKNMDADNKEAKAPKVVIELARGSEPS